ncbi:uncharacterized protein LOC128956180 [Oppia nitens]|uniref:uncharacterized protein LOC128956180 n=1 Tax=Oppia nitens TaxID=1686743 RepID=UPI0023DA877F|nr:uncharacterized protein LOC128956180 [Oppia nitens]
MASNETMSLPSMTKKMYLRSDSSIRQSFDRFGDDLTELLLSYLSFDEKIRHECVSKQWQRLVFQSHNYIEDNEIYVKNYEKIMKKLLNSPFSATINTSNKAVNLWLKYSFDKSNIDLMIDYESEDETVIQ